ncbi:hypothetical protein Fcan01_22542 [Folsomia candida]|uniref:TATA box binding protein associated factor (TAF) histone-like fold domain-containing protein n=1 Tax=Folsomia candida TaxID=158441 RepID=A0A226DDB5_FOLCA|nr:hypothetical protein Fcan01_22542 [Folsomia candida]
MENSENTSMEEDGQLVLYSGSSGLDPSPSSNNSNSNETMSNDSPDFETEMDGDNAGEEDDDNEEDGNDDEVEEEEERVEYSGSVELSAESIQAMAQSIGVNLSEEVSIALGDLALKKLRAATLLAIGFADHETAPGLRTSDFSKAEQVYQSPSFGHRSSQAEPPVRPIDPGNFCIADEGPEIDLYTTLSSPNISEFIMRRLDPEFYVHQAVVNSRFAVLSSSDDDEEEEGEEEGVEDEDEEENDDDDDDEDNDEEEEDTEFEEQVLPKLDLEDINDHGEISKNVDSDAGNASGSPSNNTMDAAIVVGNGPTLNSPPEVTADEGLQLLQENEQLALEASSNAKVFLDTQYMQLDEDWLEYMRVFVSCFLDTKHVELPTVTDDDALVDENQDVDLDNENTFQCIIEDLTSNSAFPVADVICDFFCDHLNGLFTQVSSTSKQRGRGGCDLATCR